MRIETVFIESFKNLKNFDIDFDQSQTNTVLLGQNATGKSNFIEALILIFKYLDLQQKPNDCDYFVFEIKYLCNGYNIVVSLKNKQYGFIVNGEIIGNTEFYSKKDYLPKYVFTYYSGQSDRLNRLFWEHQDRFYSNIIKKDFKKENIDDLRRLFYVQQIHSYFVLLAFYSFEEDELNSKVFLRKHFGIEDIESILFVVKKASTTWKGDKRFWGAEGLVQLFLSTLWDYALAPIYHSERVNIDFRHKPTKDRLFLFLSNKKKLHKFVEAYFKNLKIQRTKTNLFKALESTYISDLLDEVRIKVKKNIDGELKFKDLSEGEQQLLTVLGLLKFTQDDESLVLLDEPDTHLNPLWKWEYLKLLNDVVKKSSGKNNDTTQVIINTHDPLVIGSLEHNQVRVFNRDEKTGHVTATEPDVSPKGLGVAGILTSELFGLRSTLDGTTLSKIEERDNLIIKKDKKSLLKKEAKKLEILNEELSTLGFTAIYRDPLYQKFRIALSKIKEYQKPELNEKERENVNDIIQKVLKEIVSGEKKKK